MRIVSRIEPGRFKSRSLTFDTHITCTSPGPNVNPALPALCKAPRPRAPGCAAVVTLCVSSARPRCRILEAIHGTRVAAIVSPEKPDRLLFRRVRGDPGRRQGDTERSRRYWGGRAGKPTTARFPGERRRGHQRPTRPQTSLAVRSDSRSVRADRDLRPQRARVVKVYSRTGECGSCFTFSSSSSTSTHRSSTNCHSRHSPMFRFSICSAARCLMSMALPTASISGSPSICARACQSCTASMLTDLLSIRWSSDQDALHARPATRPTPPGADPSAPSTRMSTTSGATAGSAVVAAARPTAIRSSEWRRNSHGTPASNPGSGGSSCPVRHGSRHGDRARTADGPAHRRLPVCRSAFRGEGAPPLRLVLSLHPLPASDRLRCLGTGSDRSRLIAAPRGGASRRGLPPARRLRQGVLLLLRFGALVDRPERRKHLERAAERVRRRRRRATLLPPVHSVRGRMGADSRRRTTPVSGVATHGHVASAAIREGSEQRLPARSRAGRAPAGRRGRT